MFVSYYTCKFVFHLSAENSCSGFAETGSFTNLSLFCFLIRFHLYHFLGLTVWKVIAVCYLFRVARSPVTVQFLDRLTCDVFVIQGSELGMEGDVTVFRTNSGGYVVIPVGKRGWELLGVKVTEKQSFIKGMANFRIFFRWVEVGRGGFCNGYCWERIIYFKIIQLS